MTETSPTTSTAVATATPPSFTDADRAAVRPGMTVRVHQRITDVTPEGKERERVQVFDGIVLARHGGMTPGATFTVRKISEGIGVEKIFPFFLPSIEKIEVVKRAKVRRARLYYLRTNPKKLREAKKKK